MAAQDQNGTEGIDHADASYLIVEDNHVVGVGDDLIGLHMVDHLVVRNNFCSGVDGSILLTNCTDFVVEGNYVERTAAPNRIWYSGCLLRCTNESAAPKTPPNSGGRIVHNELVLPAGVDGAQGLSYMMRLEGVRRAVVANNILRCGTTNVVNHAISVEPSAPVVGWTDAEGIEPDNIARPRWLSIHGNRSVGGVDVGMGEGASLATDLPGPISWRENDAAIFTVVGTGSSFSVSNRVIGGSGDGLKTVSGQLVPDALLLWSGTVSATGAQTSAANGGVTRFYPNRKGIVFLVKATLATALAAGAVTVHLARNGSFDPADDLVLDPSTPNCKRRFYYSGDNPGVNNRFTASDYLEAYVVGTATTPSPLNLVVELYGMYTDNDFSSS